MKHLSLVLLVFCLFSAKATFSQSQRKPQSKTDVVEYSKIYYYTFKGEALPDVLELLKQDLQNRPYVRDVKIEYKPERKAGQVKVITREKVVTHEGEEQFGPLIIKQALGARNLEPADVRIEDYTD